MNHRPNIIIAKLAIISILLLFYAEESLFAIEKKKCDCLCYVTVPEELAPCFKREYSYRLDLPDKPQSPEETYFLKTGDCDDFAVLASTVLNDLNIPNHILKIGFRGLNVAHAITIWKSNNGTYNFISNDTMTYSGEKTIKKAVAKYYPDWSEIVFMDEDRRALKMFKRK